MYEMLEYAGVKARERLLFIGRRCECLNNDTISKRNIASYLMSYEMQGEGIASGTDRPTTN